MQAMAGTMWALGAANKAPAVFSPDQLANLALWLKADALTLNDGDVVSSWTDSSANAAHCTQATPTAKPTYKANIKNGKPILRFDGGDWLSVPTSVFSGVSSNTVFVVCNAVASATYKNIFTYSYNAFGLGTMVTANNGTPASKFRYGVGNSTGSVLSYSTTDATGWRLLCGVFSDSGNTQKVYLADAQEDSDTNNYTLAFNANDRPAIGAARNSADITASLFAGDMAEIIFYSAALSDADRGSVQTYLATKYGITLA